MVEFNNKIDDPEMLQLVSPYNLLINIINY